MTEEINYFTCGYCIYGQMVEPPEDMKDKYPNKRGYCIFEPPAVFPMPQTKQTKIQALGNQQTKVDFVPLMMRPVMEDYEPMCGRGVLNAEAMEGLGIEPDKDYVVRTDYKAGCGGCKDETAKCNCDTNEVQDNVG
jgi:hypothetical protein